VIRPDDLGGPAEAMRWLERLSGDAEAAEGQVGEAVVLLNRALHAHRAASQDPYVHEVSPATAVAIRIGYGTGEELADGRWSDARELPTPKRGRLDEVDPQERVAAVLAGRERVHPAETLLQRARLDLAQGRLEEARYGQRAAAEAARDGADDDLRDRVEKFATEIEEALGR
jgi:hypothetical protein